MTAVRLLIADWTRRLLDRHGAPGYGQMGEDRILASLLPRELGFYVDVGSNDPCRYSNTVSLYKRGWHGLAVDANPQLIQRHRQLRPRDVAICAAVGDQEETLEFTEFVDDALSSLDPDQVAHASRSHAVKTTRTVQTQRLESICEAHDVPAHFALLSVDVEGHDLAVLRSLDLARFRPGLVVVEIHDLDLIDPTTSPVFVHLTAQDYRLVGYGVANAYFVDSRATDPE